MSCDVAGKPLSTLFAVSDFRCAETGFNRVLFESIPYCSYSILLLFLLIEVGVCAEKLLLFSRVPPIVEARSSRVEQRTAVVRTSTRYSSAVRTCQYR